MKTSLGTRVFIDSQLVEKLQPLLEREGFRTLPSLFYYLARQWMLTLERRDAGEPQFLDAMRQENVRPASKPAPAQPKPKVQGFVIPIGHIRSRLALSKEQWQSLAATTGFPAIRGGFVKAKSLEGYLKRRISGPTKGQVRWARMHFYSLEKTVTASGITRRQLSALMAHRKIAKLRLRLNNLTLEYRIPNYEIHLLPQLAAEFPGESPVTPPPAAVIIAHRSWHTSLAQALYITVANLRMLIARGHLPNDDTAGSWNGFFLKHLQGRIPDNLIDLLPMVTLGDASVQLGWSVSDVIEKAGTLIKLPIRVEWGPWRIPVSEVQRLKQRPAENQDSGSAEKSPTESAQS